MSYELPDRCIVTYVPHTVECQLYRRIRSELADMTKCADGLSADVTRLGSELATKDAELEQARAMAVLECHRADYLSDQLAAKKRELDGQVLLFQDAVNENEALRARIVELNDNVALRARIAELERGYVIPKDHAGHNSVLESLEHREDQIRKYEDLVDGLRKELAEAKDRMED